GAWRHMPGGAAPGRPGGARPLGGGFARPALATGAPVTPGVLSGPQESRPPIVRRGKQILVNMHRPLPAEYKVIFMERLSVADHVAGPDDVEGLKRFCELVRAMMQATLDRESEGRPLVKLARELQARYGDPEEE